MSVVSGVSNKTTGLVLHIDAYNTNKSWKGQPITNNFPLPTPAANGDVTFPANGTGTFQRIYSGTYGGYDILGTDVVYKYVLGTLGCHYHGITFASIPAGTTVTFSVDYYIDPSVTGYPETNYIGNMEGVLSNSFTDPTPGTVGVWKRGVITTTAGSTGSANALLYPGACGNTRLASGGFILYKNPQVEYASFASGYSPIGRTNTQSLIDMTGNSTVTINSLTYNSDNTISFNGSSNYVTISAPLKGNYTTPFTLLAVAKTTTASGWQTVIGTQGTNRQIGFSGTSFYYGGNAGGGNLFVNGGTISANTWYHMAFTFDGTTAYGYLNGIQTTGSIGSNGGTIGNNYLGSYASSGGEYLNGSIGLAQIYDRALSANEIRDNFNSVRRRFNI